MIKFILACVLLHLSAAINYCGHDSHCQENECCFGAMIGRKRFVFDNMFYHTGICRRLAQEGQTCEPNYEIFGASLAHSLGCQCAEGLECHGEWEAHHGGSHTYTNPTCIPEGTYEGPIGSHHHTTERIPDKTTTIQETTTKTYGDVYTQDDKTYGTGSTPTFRPHVDINRPNAGMPGK